MAGAIQPHQPELWDACREAVVSDGLTLAAAAERVGIPVSTVEKRAAREEWARQRDEARMHARSYRTRVYQLKNKLLDAALESGEVQPTQTWQAVERAFPEKTYAGITEPQKRQLIGVFINVMVRHLGETAPSLLPELEGHLPGIASSALVADWEVVA